MRLLISCKTDFTTPTVSATASYRAGDPAGIAAYVESVLTAMPAIASLYLDSPPGAAVNLDFSRNSVFASVVYVKDALPQR